MARRLDMVSVSRRWRPMARAVGVHGSRNRLVPRRGHIGNTARPLNEPTHHRRYGEHSRAPMQMAQTDEVLMSVGCTSPSARCCRRASAGAREWRCAQVGGGRVIRQLCDARPHIATTRTCTRCVASHNPAMARAVSIFTIRSTSRCGPRTRLEATRSPRIPARARGRVEWRPSSRARRCPRSVLTGAGNEISPCAR